VNSDPTVTLSDPTARLLFSDFSMRSGQAFGSGLNILTIYQLFEPFQTT
jgi:hypothetical protein